MGLVRNIRLGRRNTVIFNNKSKMKQTEKPSVEDGAGRHRLCANFVLRHDLAPEEFIESSVALSLIDAGADDILPAGNSGRRCNSQLVLFAGHI